jgi:hypothetical protein
MTSLITPKFQHAALKFWHAWFAGAFLVAYLTADEDTYAMHFFAGYAVLAALVVRLIAALVAPQASPWQIARTGRKPIFGWFAKALLVSVGLAAITGAIADFSTWFEDPHEAISEACLWIIFGHIAFVTYVYGGKRLFTRLSPSNN